MALLDAFEQKRKIFGEMLQIGIHRDDNLAASGREPGLKRGCLSEIAAQLDDPKPRLACDEAFGPVCTLQPYATLDEAIEGANSTRYGLQAGIFTANVRTALAAARRLEFGGVTVNEAPTFRADQMPYGGVKESGNTREGPAWTVREMTEERLVVLQL